MLLKCLLIYSMCDFYVFSTLHNNSVIFGVCDLLLYIRHSVRPLSDFLDGIINFQK